MGKWAKLRGTESASRIRSASDARKTGAERADINPFPAQRRFPTTPSLSRIHVADDSLRREKPERRPWKCLKSLLPHNGQRETRRYNDRWSVRVGVGGSLIVASALAMSGSEPGHHKLRPIVYPAPRPETVCLPHAIVQ